MIDPASGPYLFDTSAEGWLARNVSTAPAGWLRAYLSFHRVHISAVTVIQETQHRLYARFELVRYQNVPGFFDQFQAQRARMRASMREETLPSPFGGRLTPRPLGRD